MSLMTVEEIKKIIPHRYPFLLLDRVEEMEIGKKIIAKKNVSVNEPFFQGHFPHEPVMPGVLILEAMAQAGAVALLSLEEFQGKLLISVELIKQNLEKSNARRYPDVGSRIIESEIFCWNRQRDRIC